MSKGKLNWMHWKNLATVTLKEAVALSLGLEPVNTDVDSEEFRTRLSIAINHIKSGKLRARSSGSATWGGVEYRVTLTNFRAWGEVLPEPFTFPEQFPMNMSAVSAKLDPVPSKPKETPIRSDARENLLRVIRALDKKVDLPEREVVGFVVQMLESMGFDGPKDDTVRKLLKEARNLQPDTEPK